MDLIYNITFFVGQEREQELVAMLREDFLNAAVASSVAKFLHLTKVRHNSAMGMMDGEEQAVSLGMQFTLSGEDALAVWRDGDLSNAFSLISSRFGEEVLHFDTQLEILR